ncbi:MAG: hypothetical protein ACYCVH_06595 [Ignavibacteriaceae bacterium]
MKKNHPLVIYLLIFLAAAMMLRVLRLINTPAGEILSYVLSAYGIVTVYLSIGRNKKLNLFTGTVTFLAGILLFVINNFDFFNLSGILVPSVLFIFGISSLMLFIDSPSDKRILTVAVIFLIFATVFTILLGSPALRSFFYALFYIVKKYWLVVLILIIIILLTKREE